MAPPVGVQLHKEYSVGELIGRGAFGTVHAVVLKNSTTPWACKVTPVPKRTKKGTTDAEVAYGRLWSENLLYSAHFRPLLGTVLPKIPLPSKDGLSHFYDQAGGYRCLVMERMDCLLWDALPELWTSKSSIALGPIFIRLVDIVEAIHDTGHVVLDVKPDNLMVTSAESKGQASVSERLAARIRMVDLGLFKTYRNAEGHVPNTPGKALQGTPLYASLNQHNCQLQSRRDDLEALLYVMGDAVLTLQGRMQKTKAPYGTGDKASYLPWSQEGSDAAIGTVKRAMIADPTSVYYTTMPAAVARRLYAATEMVRGYEYTTKPRYQELKNLLQDIALDVPTNKRGRSKPATPLPTVPPTLPTESARRSQRLASGAPVESPAAAKAARATKAVAQPSSKRVRRTNVDDMDVVMEDVESNHVDDMEEDEPEPRKPAAKTKKTRTKPDTMECEPEQTKTPAKVAKTTRATASDAKPKASATPSKRQLAAVIRIADGKHVGMEHWMSQGGCERLVIGSAPTSNKGDPFKVVDNRMAANHALLELTILDGTTKSVAVKVTDLKSKEGIQFNGKLIPSGKSEMAFCNTSTFSMGGHVFKVRSA